MMPGLGDSGPATAVNAAALYRIGHEAREIGSLICDRSRQGAQQDVAAALRALARLRAIVGAGESA